MAVLGAGWLNTGMDQFLERALDAAALRQQLLTNNIANINTPGYKRNDIDFNATLKQAMSQYPSAIVEGRRTHPRHLEISQQGAPFGMQKETWYVQRNDESNVSIETENASRDQNQLLYSAAAQLYGDRMKWLSVVLDSRR